jgi:hypothetical protein
MNPLTRYPVLASLLRPFRRSQQKTCAALVAALCQCAQASSFSIAGQLSCLTEVQFGSALTRLYRFLRNERFDNRLLTEQLLRLLGQEQKHLLLALDWTCWQDRFSVLTASVCVGTRSVPVASSACVKRQLARSQNLWEETFLRLVVDRLRAVEVEQRKVRLRSKTKGARLSLARIGSYYWQRMSRQLKLTARFVREHLPPPQLRIFKWLTAPQK